MKVRGRHTQGKTRPHRRWQRLMGLMGATLVGSSWLALPGQQALGQAPSAATVTEILDSSQVYIQNRTAQVNSVAQQRQQVRTQAARTSLRFSTGAVARLGHNSSLVVGQCAQLNRGTLLVNGTLNGCSTSTVAGVRGTIYTIEVTEAGQTIIQVYEGEVVVGRNPNPELAEPMPGEDGFDPDHPSIDPAVPSTDPLVPFINPVEPSVPPSEPPSPPPEPPPTTPEPPTTAPPTTAPPTTAPPTGPFFTPLTNAPGAKPGPVLLAFGKQDAADDGEDPVPETYPAADGDVVEFTAADSLTVAEGQQVIVDPEQDQAVILALSAEDFIELLEGPLIDGFALEIPGISNLRQSFERLFPGVPLPYYWVPALPIPPVRFPFPF